MCPEALKRALATPGPVMVDAIVDPNEPPFPPKASLEELASLTRSLVRGTPARWQIARTIASDKVRELI